MYLTTLDACIVTFICYWYFHLWLCATSGALELVRHIQPATGGILHDDLYPLQ